MSYKVGIVGFGKMGILHGGLLNSYENVELVAVADKSLFVLEGFKSVKPSLNYYTSYEKMINNEELDAIVITTPTFLHMEVAIMAAKKGIDVFVEKPLCNNVNDGMKLLDVAKSSNSAVFVAFCVRENPIFKYGRSIVKEGKYGEIKKISSYMFIADVLKSESGWRYDPKKSGGGVVMDFGIHMLDLLYTYFGEISSVDAKVNKIYSKKVEDESEVQIKFSSGVNASFETSWSKEEYRKSYQKIVIEYEDVVLEITDQTCITKNKMGEIIEKKVYPDLYEGYFFDIGGALYSNQIETYMKYISKDNNDRLKSLREGIYIQKIVEKIYESANLSKSVDTIELNSLLED